MHEKIKIYETKLEKHLSIMRQQDQITTWHDQDISAGKQWKDEITLHLNTANVILLLISSSFIHSEYCYSVEMKHALQRHDRGEVRVVPIILRPVDWENAPFSKLQVLPSNGTPIASWKDQDEAFVNVVKAIRKIVTELLIDQLKHENFHDYLEKKYLEALTTYNQTIDIDPYNSPAYSNKGDALYALKNYEEALIAYEKALQLDVENAMAHNGKGKVLCKLHLYEEALNAHNEAIKLNPGFAEAYRDKATALEKLAILARNKADELENQQTYSPIVLLDQERDKGSIRLGEMISAGKIQTGEQVYVSKKPSQLAKIVDGRTVEFQGRQMSINEWARKMAGWSSINIYSNVYLERTKQPLENLREGI